MNKLNEKGQMLIFVTLGFVLLGIFTGLVIDMGRGYLMNARLQRVVDAASIAAADALKGQVGNQSDAEAAAKDAALMNGFTCCSAGNDLTIDYVPKSVAGGPDMLFVQITGTAQIPTTFSRLLHLVSAGSFDSLQVSAFAQAGPERPVDLILVLDRSGSMANVDGTGTTRIRALKTAVNAFLDNSFSGDDRVGMVSFATRGCGNASGNDSTVDGNCTPDKPLGTSISALKAAVEELCEGSGCGGTNTMEALRTAGDEINLVFNDPERATSRKAIVLVTDGQPTFMKRSNTTECRSNPLNGAPLPSPGDSGSFPNGCVHGVASSAFDRMLRRPLSGGSFTQIPGSGVPQLYKDVIRCTRSLANCVTNGAMYEANKIRNYGLAGGKDVIIFAISIGDDLGPGASNPQSSMDANAQCLLARIANDPGSINICDQVYTTTADGDTHADLKENWPCPSGPCIDATQQRGKVYMVSVQGSVVNGLDTAFRDIAALLKLRLTI